MPPHALDAKVARASASMVLAQTSGNQPVLGPRPVKTVEDQWKPSCPLKYSYREPLDQDSNVEKKKKIGPVKSFGGRVNLGFSMWLPVLRSGKGPKVFPMSVGCVGQVTCMYCCSRVDFIYLGQAKSKIRFKMSIYLVIFKTFRVKNGLIH